MSTTQADAPTAPAWDVVRRTLGRAEVVAKRGDLVVTVREHRDWYVGLEARTRMSVEVGIVRSISRAGVMLAAEMPNGTRTKAENFDRWYVVPAGTIDVTAAFAAAKAHTYPGNAGQTMPFDSVAGAKAFLQPFRQIKEDS